FFPKTRHCTSVGPSPFGFAPSPTFLRAAMRALPVAVSFGGGIETRGRPPQQARVVLKPAKTDVARVTEQLADELSAVIVVDVKPAPTRFLPEDVAATLLLLEEAIIVLDCHSVETLEVAFPVRYFTSLAEFRICVPPQAPLGADLGLVRPSP